MSNQQMPPQSKLTNGLKYLKEFFVDVLALEKGVDKLATIHEIKHKKSMSGANAWMLMCSIVIASIGLDLNSPAVIIGAMLISPLMSPILGIGLAVGINDRDTLKTSLIHFGTAIFIALITSVIYFSLSPLSALTPEIQARTEPTFLDIFVAFFGGIAGIVSIARKDISTTLPGVAIATALMPPLCVSGWGIANGNWATATSSFYLFFLNTFFVALATYVIVRYLRFPFRDYMDEDEKRKTKIYMALFSILIIIPSLFIFNKVINRVSTNLKIEEFVSQIIDKEDRPYLDDYIFTPGKDSSLLVLKVYGNAITKSDLSKYQEGLNRLGLDNTRLKLLPTSEITLEKFTNLDKKIADIKDMAQALDIVKQEKNTKDKEISLLQEKLSQTKLDTAEYTKIRNQIKIMDTDVNNVIASTSQFISDGSYIENLPLFIIIWEKLPLNHPERKQKIERFLKEEFKDKNIQIIHIKNPKK